VFPPAPPTHYHAVPVPGGHLHLADLTTAARPRAGLLLVPGYTDHSARYDEWFQYFAAKGYTVWGQDLRGHGLSSGPRGYVRRFSDYVDDLEDALRQAREHYPGPWVLVGHSTGGLVVLSALLRRRTVFAELAVTGAILTCPLLAIRLEASPWRRWLGVVASRLMPRWSVGTGVAPYDNSHDPEEVRKKAQDPLAFSAVNVRWYTESNAEMAWVRRQAVDLPLLGLQAGADRVVAPQATAAFFAACPEGDFISYPEMYHEILLERDRESVFADMAAWLERHLAGR